MPIFQAQPNLRLMSQQARTGLVAQVGIGWQQTQAVSVPCEVASTFGRFLQLAGKFSYYNWLEAVTRNLGSLLQPSHTIT